MNSWGEKIDIRLQPTVKGVSVRITSTAKSWMGTNRHERHLKAITDSLRSALGAEAVVVAGEVPLAAASDVKRDGEILRATGTNGAVTLYQGKVVISRPKGLSTALLHGFKGDKELRLAKITSVQLREPGAITAGYLQFEVGGGITSTRGLWEATSDENTVVFAKAQLNSFLEFKAAVDAALDGAERPSTPAPTAPAASAVEQIRQWKDLLDSGAITADEYEAQKRKILG